MQMPETMVFSATKDKLRERRCPVVLGAQRSHQDLIMRFCKKCYMGSSTIQPKSSATPSKSNWSSVAEKKHYQKSSAPAFTTRRQFS